MNHKAVLGEHDSQVTELSLLLSRQQVLALEEVAQLSSMTIGQVLRQMVGDCLINRYRTNAVNIT